MWFTKSRNVSSIAFLLTVLFSVSISVSHAGHALLIAYPDYKVSVDKGIESRLDLGHAGILLISKTGVTSYYEFGRYDYKKEGKIRQVSVPNIYYSQPGEVNKDSVLAVLKKLSDYSGQRGKILGAYVAGVDYGLMTRFVQKSLRDWPDYHWYSNNCATYAAAVIRSGKPKNAPIFPNAITTPEVIVRDYLLHGAGSVRYDPNENTFCFQNPGGFWTGMFRPKCEPIRLR